MEGNGFGMIENEQFVKHLELTSDPSLKDNDLIFRVGLHNFLAKLEKTGKKIEYVVDNPEIGFDPLTCIPRPVNILTRHASSHCAVSRSVFDERNAKYLKAVQSVLSHFPSIQTFCPGQHLCDTLYCYGEREGVMLYLDDDHLSYSGSRFIGSKFFER